MATKNNIRKTLLTLGMQYGHLRQSFTEEQMMLEFELWCEEFAPIDDRVFLAAVKQHMREARFFPMISEVHTQIRKLEDIADGGDDWAQAWAAVKGAIGRFGAWGTVDEVRSYLAGKLPPAMADDACAIVQRIGWREFCSFDVDQESTWRAQFRDVYNRVRGTRMERQRMTPEVQQLISDMAQKMAANRLRLNAPDAEEQGDEVSL